MQPGVLWLVRLGTERGLFSVADCRRVRQAVGEKAELVDFAQQLVDDGLVEDVAALEKIAGQALVNGAMGKPDSDPFEETGAGGGPSAVLPSAGASTPPFQQFSFNAIAGMDDAALAATFRNLLRWAVGAGAGDLHLSAGTRPFIRRNRALEFIDPHVLTADEALRLNTVLLSGEQRRTFLERRDLDYALGAGDGTGRCRVNLMFHKQGAAGSYRLVPERPPALADLGVAAHRTTIERLLSYHNGLVLVTGPVGSGKTTTLGALVAHLNASRDDHIITVEDPIEFIHAGGRCNVTQREVGRHTRTFFSALKGALREDPDIIAIGELRDLETIEMAVSAAETGHLVLATMHTSDAASTLNRILDVFPPGQQAQIRASVAESLRGIICQRLLPAESGGLVLAVEILVNSTAISNLIREGKTSGVRNSMETGVREGMCLMDNVVFGLWQEKKISKATALATITNRVLRAKIT